MSIGPRLASCWPHVGVSQAQPDLLLLRCMLKIANGAVDQTFTDPNELQKLAWVTGLSLFHTDVVWTAKSLSQLEPPRR